MLIMILSLRMAEFFKEMVKVRLKTNFSNFNRSFEPTEEDWNIIKNSLTSINLFLTNKCNMDCKICYVDGFINPEEMSIKDIKFVISKIGINKKVLLFALEPTVRNDIFEIIKIIIDSGNFPLLFTNGLKLTNPSYVKKLKKSGIMEVFISFDSFRKETQKKLGENIYKFKLRALKNLKRYGIYTFISISFKLIEYVNQNELDDFVKFLINHNDFIKGLFLILLNPVGKMEIKQEHFFTYSDIIKKVSGSEYVKCDKNYFLEFEKFRLNLSRFLRNFNINLPVESYIITVPFKIEDNVLKEVITTKLLKK